MNDKIYKEFIRKEFKDYFLNNDNGTVSPNVLWDAWKAVIRGRRSAFSAYRKKGQQKHLLELHAKMKDFEIPHFTQKNPQVLTQLKCIKQEINKIYNEQNEIKF